MNICHVNLASGFSGGEQQTLQLIKQQIKLGYTLTVVANPKSRLVQEVQQLDCRLILASHFTRQHSKAVTKHCQLIHVHEGRAIYWAYLQAKLTGIPYIVTRRIDNPMKNKWLANLAYNKARAIVGLSREIVRQITLRHPSAYAPKIPSSPVPYSVNIQNTERLKAQFNDKFIVIQAANLLKHKGHDVTIKAAQQLATSHPNIQFVLLGDGKERSTLELQAKGLTNVTFMGRQTNMGDWFNIADVLIHPSYTEGLGSVILEAILGGLPVIASNAGGIPDIIDGKQSGWLIEPGDDSQLAQYIIELAESPELLDKLTAGAQEVLPTFDIKNTAQQYQKLYQEIM